MNLLEGFVLADKPKGLGSAALVGRLKHELKRRAAQCAPAGEPGPGSGAPQRKIKVGHTGTLDRFASGLMLLLTGRATALADQFLHADKGYVGRFQFGAFTDTHDPHGEIVESVSPAETRRFLESERERVMRAVLAIREATRQQPPLYSALKQDGRRFSDRARGGQTELPAWRDIRVYELELLRYDLEAGALDLDLYVSGGTYIRAFARDLSRELDFPVHLSELRRYRLGGHRLDGDVQAVRLPDAGVDNDTAAMPDFGAEGAASPPLIWRPRFSDAAPRPARDRPAGAHAASADGPPALVRDARLALPDWPRCQVPGSQLVDILQGRCPILQSLPERTGTDFFIESGAAPIALDTGGADENSGSSGVAGRLLAWARVTRPGSYKYMRVFG